MKLVCHQATIVRSIFPLIFQYFSPCTACKKKIWLNPADVEPTPETVCGLSLYLLMTLCKATEDMSADKVLGISVSRIIYNRLIHVTAKDPKTFFPPLVMIRIPAALFGS